MQLLEILEWKWEILSMEFITKLPNIEKKNVIMVYVNNLSKENQLFLDTDCIIILFFIHIDAFRVEKLEEPTHKTIFVSGA